MSVKIKIESGDPATGLLTLSDKGHSKAEKGDEIVWEIKVGANVTSIELIKLKEKTTNIYAKLPYQGLNKWRALVDKNAPDFAESEYLITWKAGSGSGTYTHDPKISVLPSTFNFLKLTTGIALGAAALLSMKFLFKKKSNE